MTVRVAPPYFAPGPTAPPPAPLPTTISLHDVRFRGPHGVHPAEATLGGDYVVHVRCTLRPRDAPLADELSGTLDYAGVYAVVAAVMAERADLLETLAEGIVARVRQTWPSLLAAVEAEVRKLHPPLPGRVGAAGVVVRWEG